MKVSTIGEFLELLERSQLLTDKQLGEIRADFEQSDPAPSLKSFAQDLVRKSLLTRWQAGMLLAGRSTLMLGKYKLLKELGRGGMGAVFKAQQQPLGRIVALKVMSSKLVKDKVAVGRFHREIQAAAALNHANIVAAYDADQIERTHFLVMEYVAGEDLNVVAKRDGKLPPLVACDYIRQAALGLQHAHERGMAHRDIKLSNLLLTKRSDGESLVKILDMGLARFTSESSEDASLTATGQIMGTPDYISPEQARSTKSADIRSDIYSLGCCLFRLLTGQLPFSGDNVVETLMARVTNDAPSVLSLEPDVAPEIGAIVAKMLERDPAQRYQTPADLAADLGIVLGISNSGSDGETRAHEATQDFSPGDAFAPLDGLPVAGSSGELPAITSVDDGIGQFLQNLSHESSGDEPATPTLNSISETQVAPAADRVAPFVDTPAAEPDLRSSITARKADDRKRLILIGSAAAVMVVLIIAVVIYANSGTTTLIVDWPLDQRDSATLTLDGRKQELGDEAQLVFTGKAGERKLVLTRTGYEKIELSIPLDRGQTETVVPEWKPTAETVQNQELVDLQARVEKTSSSLSGSFAVTDPKAVKLRRELLRHWRANYGQDKSIEVAKLMSQLSWPADLLDRQDIDPFELQLAGGGDPAKVPAELVAVFGTSRFAHENGYEAEKPLYTPDGQTLLVTNGPWLFAWDPATGAPRWQQLLGEGNHFSPIVLSRDGERVAVRAKDQHFRIWDTATGDVLGTFAIPDEIIVGLCFSNDGRRVAAVGTEATFVIWDLESGAHTEPVKLADASVFVCVAHPTAERLALACADNTVRVWNFERQLQQYEVNTTQPVSLAFDRTQPRLAVGGIDGSGIAIWNLESGEVEQELTATTVSALEFSRDGKQLAVGTYGESRMFDLSNPADSQLMYRDRDHAIRGFDFSPTENTIAMCSQSGQVVIWDLEQNQRLNESPLQPRVFALSHDGAQLATASRDDQVIVWDVATGQKRWTNTSRHSYVLDVKFSIDDSVLAVSGASGGIELRHAESGVLNRVLPAEEWTRTISFSPDNKLLASVSHAGIVTLWDLQTGLIKRKLTGHADQVWLGSFSPSGDRLVTFSRDGVLKFWDPSSGAEKATAQSHNVTGIYFDPRGKDVYTTGGLWGQPLAKWNTYSGSRQNIALTGQELAHALAFSLDDTLIAAIADSQRARLEWWPTEGASYRNERINLQKPRSFMTEIAFAPDSRHLFTANMNGTIYVFRLPEWPGD